MSIKKNVRNTSTYFKTIAAFVMLTVASLGLGGCDNTSSVTNLQFIAELSWAHDGSALYGFIQKSSVTQYQSFPSIAFNIAKFNTDGSFVKSISVEQSASTDISYNIFVSPDNTELITQLGIDVYRVNPATNAYTKLYQQLHLITVSPDQHYAVGTTSQAVSKQKTVLVVDLTAQPTPRVVALHDVVGLNQVPGMWLSNGRFAITVADSIKSHIEIWDTLCNLITSVSGAETAFHNTAYIPTTNTLYFRTEQLLTSDGSVDKINLTTMARSNVISQPVDNFDVASDESVMVYNRYIYSADSTKLPLTMTVRNLATGAEKVLTNTVLAYCVLSPTADKVAYVHPRDENFGEVYVIAVTKP